MDAVDDTVLVKKMLVSPLCKELDELMKDKAARKVVWYMLNARDTKNLLPDVISLLEVGDKSVTCKKPRDVSRIFFTPKIVAIRDLIKIPE